MKRIFYTLFFLSFVFVSCKKETTFVKRIENTSDYTFTVTFYNTINSEQETHEITPHSSKIFFIQTLEGANTEPEKCLANIRNLEVQTQEHLLFILDPLNEGNWDVEVSENKKQVRQTCVMYVDNVDFVFE